MDYSFLSVTQNVPYAEDMIINLRMLFHIEYIQKDPETVVLKEGYYQCIPTQCLKRIPSFANPCKHLE